LKLQPSMWNLSSTSPAGKKVPDSLVFAKDAEVWGFA
jgi:hypothetical protein